ncbi:MAG: UDP-3-O-[3-hydroxymyristoyl] N-acetylglucosamine deacetylase [Candidatus Brocadiae bacterium]|nr:UDP-3-O-[3-hydroxymyristoyl] N-acetylglucosamine deacetylase [Candidatus Brocadiia bacterium]
MRQNTIQKPVSIAGTGLHSGKTIHLKLLPAPCNHHIVFVRVDLPGKPCIPACIHNLSSQMRCTALVHNKAKIHTTEHLLATCFAMKLDNLVIEVDGPEIPGMDGSALPFYNMLKEAGIQEQEAQAEEIIITKEILLQKKANPLWQKLLQALKIGGKIHSSNIQVLPHPSGLKLEYFLDYSFSHIPKQNIALEIEEDTFAKEIAPARTFALQKEIGIGQKILGLGKGTTSQNTLIITDKGEILDNTLRFPDELARHKILDLLGDISLVGKRIHAHIIARYSGHSLNAALAKTVDSL